MSTSFSTETGLKWLKMGRLGKEMPVRETGVDMLDLILSVLSVNKTINLEHSSLDEVNPLKADGFKRQSTI